MLSGLTANQEQARLLAGAGIEAERSSFVNAHPACRDRARAPARRLPAGALRRRLVTGSRNFRPELSLVAIHEDDPGTVAAYLQTSEFDAYFAATGRRVGRPAGGDDEASLDVDSENPTGALGIYERAGFVVETRWTNYSLEVPPAC